MLEKLVQKRKKKLVSHIYKILQNFQRIFMENVVNFKVHSNCLKISEIF